MPQSRACQPAAGYELAPAPLDRIDDQRLLFRQNGIVIDCGRLDERLVRKPARQTGLDPPDFGDEALHGSAVRLRVPRHIADESS